ncbi:MAG TPA: hypothetical protein VNI01_06815, partial [Elusimicrobiota bacterium]|nr:hypothetical protein [Elusimicrobiota bacterium]
TFFGDRPQQRGRRAHAHEAGPLLLWPVLLLAAGSAVAGALGPSGVLGRMLGVREPFHLEAAASATGLVCAALGFAMAWLATMVRPGFDWEWRAARPDLSAAFDSDCGVQPLAHDLARGVAALADGLAGWWESRRWDAFTEALADSCVGLGEGLSGLSRGLINDYLWWMLAGTAAFASLLVLWR